MRPAPLPIEQRDAEFHLTAPFWPMHATITIDQLDRRSLRFECGIVSVSVRDWFAVYEVLDRIGDRLVLNLIRADRFKGYCRRTDQSGIYQRQNVTPMPAAV